MTRTPGPVETAVGAAPVLLTLRPAVVGVGAARSLVGGDTIAGSDIISVAITRWRNRADARPDPATVTVAMAAAAFGGAVALPELGDIVAVRLTPEALAWAGLAADDPAAWRFLGRVTDADSTPGTPRHPATVTLSATGPQANAADVGTAAWPQQLDGDRAAAILAEWAAQSPDDYLAAGPVDPGQVEVLARPADAQPARQLLEDLASDSGGELVELRDGSLAWHDARHRLATVAAVELWARHLIASPAWRKQLAGLANDVTLGYGPEPQASVTVADQPVIDRVGRFPASRGTQLVDATAADSRANDLVGRWGTPRWRLDALTVDLIRTVDPPRAGQLLGLSFADLVAVDGLPAADGTAASARLWVEGETEEITRTAWRLQLVGADYGLMQAAPRWSDVPAELTWATADPAVTWRQAIAWELPLAGADRWLDVPADLTWAELDPAATWATY